MGRAIGAIMTIAVVLSSQPVAAAAPTAPDELPEPLAHELVLPYTVLLSLEPLLAIGPYVQSGSSGHGGFSIGLGPYLRTLNDEHRRPFLPHLVPTLAADVVLPERATVGVGVGYGLSVAEVPREAYSDETRAHQSDTAVFLGRVGYLQPVGPNSAFWPRIGLSHAWGSGNDFTGYPDYVSYETQSRSTQLDLDLGFLFTVARHVAVTFGFFASVGLDGTIDTSRLIMGTPQGAESRRVHDGFGVGLGLLGYL